LRERNWKLNFDYAVAYKFLKKELLFRAIVTASVGVCNRDGGVTHIDWSISTFTTCVTVIFIYYPN